jgi:hypothetical protein
MKPSLFLALCVSFLFLACTTSNNQTAKGGVWDETENSVAVIVIDPRGSPVANARVRIIPQQDWAENILTGINPVIDSALTDSYGQVLLHTNSWPAHVEVETSTGMSRDFLSSPDSAHHISLQSTASLTGSLSPSSKPWPSSIRLAGTSYSATVENDGSFEFERLPAGEYMLVHKNVDQIQIVKATHLDSGVNQTLDSLHLEYLDSVLLDDFEDHINANSFHALTGSGWWYTSTDSSSQVFPSDLRNAWEISNDSWHNTQSLHVKLAIDTAATGKFALCGFDLGYSRLQKSSMATYNLSPVDSISFWAKGKGSMYLQIYGIPPKSPESFIQMHYKFDLDSTWKRIVVTPDQMLYTGRLLTWNDLAPNVTSFNFMSTSDADFWLDQIQIHGVSAPDIFTTFLGKQP